MSNTNCENMKDSSSCDFCNSCNYSKGLRMSEKMIFCLGEGANKSKGEGYQKSYCVFNKDVPESRYEEVLEIAKAIFKDINIEILDWGKLWPQVTPENKKKLQELPEFDAEIFKGITGIDVSNNS